MPKPAKVTLALLIVPVVATDIVIVVPEILDTLAPEPMLVPPMYIPSAIPAALVTLNDVEELLADPVADIVVEPFMSTTVVPL